MESITVNYSRKVSRNYESIGIGGSLEFKPTSDDVQAEYQKNLAILKLIVDGELSKQEPLSGGVFDNKPQPEEDDDLPDLGEQPAWVGKLDEEKSEAKSATPPPPPPPKPAPAAEAQPEKQAPTSTTNDSGGVYLARAKVFRADMKRAASSKKVYAELRIGHDDLVAHINDQYVTVKIFDPEYAALVGSMSRMKDEDTGEVRDVATVIMEKGSFVDVWGKFSPWQSNPSKSDLIADALTVNK